MNCCLNFSSSNSIHCAAHRIRIIDHGNLAFIVELDHKDLSVPGTASIFHRKKTDSNAAGDVWQWSKSRAKNHMWLEKWRDMRYKRVFIGYAPEERLPKKRSKHGLLRSFFGSKEVPAPWYGGNAVLLEIERGRYVVIESHVFEFQTIDHEPITEFTSLMGEDMIPYPYAMGTMHTYLLMMGSAVAVSNIKLLNLKTVCEQQYEQPCTDPYILYWWTADDGSHLDRVSERKRQQIIRERRVELEQQVKVLHERWRV